MLNIPILYSSFSDGLLCGIQAIANTNIHRCESLPAVNSEVCDDFWVKDQGQHVRTEIMQVPKCQNAVGNTPIRKDL